MVKTVLAIFTAVAMWYAYIASQPTDDGMRPMTRCDAIVMQHANDIMARTNGNQQAMIDYLRSPAAECKQ